MTMPEAVHSTDYIVYMIQGKELEHPCMNTRARGKIEKSQKWEDKTTVRIFQATNWSD